MTRVFTLLICVSVFFSCKKDKTEPAPEPTPQPVQTGTLNLQVLAYDSLGDLENDRSGVTISLLPTNYSVLTDASGAVSINGVPYGDLHPTLQKTWYEGAPVRLTLNSPVLNAAIPCARASAYRIENFTGYITGSDSIALSFNLDRPLPTVKSCKVAVLFDTASVNPNHFMSADSVLVASQSVKHLNVIHLPNLSKALGSLRTNTSFNVTVVSMSYGIYNSNVYNKPVLLGECLYYPDQLNFKKNW